MQTKQKLDQSSGANIITSIHLKENLHITTDKDSAIIYNGQKIQIYTQEQKEEIQQKIIQFQQYIEQIQKTQQQDLQQLLYEQNEMKQKITSLLVTEIQQPQKIDKETQSIAEPLVVDEKQQQEKPANEKIETFIVDKIVTEEDQKESADKNTDKEPDQKINMEEYNEIVQIIKELVKLQTATKKRTFKDQFPLVLGDVI